MLYAGENTTASLTLGGYDASKFVSTSNSHFSMNGPNDGFALFMQAINLNNAANKSLLPQGIQVFIEPAVAEIWLPPESCLLFEEAFGIIYNSTAEKYLVNDTLHKKLQSENASISFLFSASATGEPALNITLPYASFDLEVSQSVINNTQRYFPLMQTNNPNQYFLGRTFLQET